MDHQIWTINPYEPAAFKGNPIFLVAMIMWTFQ